MPGLGTTKGKFQVSVGWHYAYANQSFFDARVNHTFTQLWQPRERLSIMDVTGRYQITPRCSVMVSVPVVFNRFSQLFPPVGSALGVRHAWNATGLGDVTVYGQSWLLDPKEHPFGNFALGLGIKPPSGSWNLHSLLPDETGLNPSRRSVYPPAILPGDGTVGILGGFNVWKILRRPGILSNVTLYSSGLYLASTRDTNGTPSIIQGLGVPLTPNFLYELTNAAADTYSLTAGAAFRLPGTWSRPKLKSLRVRFGWHFEGLRRSNLFSGSGGFRQPGYVMGIGPGITFGHGRNYWMVDLPITITQHIDPGRSAIPGLPVMKGGTLLPALFNPARNLGMVAPVSLSVRYVRSL